MLSQRQKRLLALILTLTAVFYLSFVLLTGYDSFINAASQLGWTGWLLIVSCSFFNYCLRFLRWSIYLNQFQHRLPTMLHFVYYLSAFSLTTTPGKAGETVRSVYLKSHGIPYKQSLAMFFTERFLDVAVVTLLASLSLFTFQQYGKFVFFISIVVILFIPFLRTPHINKALKKLAAYTSKDKLRQTLLYFDQLLISARKLFSWKMIYSGLLIGAMAWGIQGLAFYFIVSTLDISIPIEIAMAIYAISLLAGAASFVPGGIGTTEAVMAVLLLSQKVDPALAVAVPIISRISTLWFAVGLGLLSSSYLGLRGIKPQQQRELI